MDFDDLVSELAPPPNRVGKCEGGLERHLPEGAVMMAFAMHLLRTTSTREVLVHPDGEHGKRFDFAGWLGKRGFERTTRTGTTSYAGRYVQPDGRAIVVNRLLDGATSLRRRTTSRSGPNARAASSTRGIPARCRDSTKVFAKPSGC
jgi:hypothetical protein